MNVIKYNTNDIAWASDTVTLHVPVYSYVLNLIRIESTKPVINFLLCRSIAEGAVEYFERFEAILIRCMNIFISS
jgi:hypothetical protein